MDPVIIEDLEKAVDIPEDGTLSRVLAREGPVRLVAFAFDAGQELTEHTASVPVIIQVISGTLTVTAAGETHRLGPTSWVFLPADEPHSVVAPEPSRLLLTMIRTG